MRSPCRWFPPLAGVVLYTFAALASDQRLADVFCPGPENKLFVERAVNLGEASDAAFWKVFCNCQCTGDNNSLAIVQEKKDGTVAVLAVVDGIRSYVIDKQSPGTPKDIVVTTREELEDGRYGQAIFDTLTFLKGVYVHKANASEPAVVAGDVQGLVSAFKEYRRRAPGLDLGKSHAAALEAYKAGQNLQAAQSLLSAAGPRPWTIDNSNVAIFNDLGFFLEQAGQYKDAVDVLVAVLAAFPDRTVAYLNLGDAYAGLKEAAKARENYRKYIDLMTRAGKQAKIPKRVVEAAK